MISTCGKGSKKLLASGSEAKNKVVARTHAWGVGKNLVWRRPSSLALSVLAYFKRCANGSHILLDEFISRRADELEGGAGRFCRPPTSLS